MAKPKKYVGDHLMAAFSGEDELGEPLKNLYRPWTYENFARFYVLGFDKEFIRKELGMTPVQITYALKNAEVQKRIAELRGKYPAVARWIFRRLFPKMMDALEFVLDPDAVKYQPKPHEDGREPVKIDMKDRLNTLQMLMDATGLVSGKKGVAQAGAQVIVNIIDSNRPAAERRRLKGVLSGGQTDVVDGEVIKSEDAEEDTS